jgi:hypothetical protein
MARRGADDKQLQGELERLYALPPNAFTGARDELAARLRREGRRDAAAEVKALPRPTASAWATSRLMRLEPARFQALLAAGGQARQAQRQVLGGRAASNVAAAVRLRDALHQARTLIEELRQRGLELLGASGSPATSGTADRLGADLQALAFTAGAESAIARGWLDHDLEPPGFEVLAGLQAAAGGAGQRATSGEEPAGKGTAREPVRRPEPRLLPGKEEPPPRHAAARDAARARTAGERQEQARRERDRAFLQQARERQRSRLAEAEAAVQQAAAESERLAATAAAAERAAVAAESEAAEARQRAGEARREAEHAGRDAERARRLLDGAGARLAAARASAAPGFKASAAGRRSGGGPR